MLPWLLALVGLAIPLVGSSFTVWLLPAVWLLGLAVVWVMSRGATATRRQRVATALVLLPVLFILGWEGGWWLIPADVAWLLIEVLRDRDRRLASSIV